MICVSHQKYLYESKLPLCLKLDICTFFVLDQLYRCLLRNQFDVLNNNVAIVVSRRLAIVVSRKT